MLLLWPIRFAQPISRCSRNSMKYLVVSTAVSDNIHFPDGRKLLDIHGGAGIYALSGIRVWDQNVGIVTGIGEDYLPKYEKWYQKNGIFTKGLIIKDKNSPETTIQYLESSERIETPRFGKDHYVSLEATPEEIENHCKSSVGVYIFKRAIVYYWERILELKRKYGFKLLWEIDGDSANSDSLLFVKKIADEVDIFSINIQEAKNLLSEQDIQAILQEFRTWRVPLIFLRMGNEGAYMIFEKKSEKVVSVPNANVVDPTGGGNSSSGGVLAGYCLGLSPVECGFMGSISAMHNMAQFGVPDYFSDEMTAQSQKLLTDLVKSCVESSNRKENSNEE